jgi:hypothetical protein
MVQDMAVGLALVVEQLPVEEPGLVQVVELGMVLDIAVVPGKAVALELDV